MNCLKILVTASFVANIILALGCIYAAIQMHSVLLTKVMRWPMDVFDQTPIGRILNRFSKEIDVVDATLPLNLRSWMQQFFAVIGFKKILLIASYAPCGFHVNFRAVLSIKISSSRHAT